MSKKSSYFKVGLFTLVALIIFGAAVLYFGLSQSFQSLLDCETFFNHSVQGLRTGASVQFRGFNVGSVTSIAITRFPGETGGRQMVKVGFNVNPDLITGEKNESTTDARRFLENEIDLGLRVYLGFQGVSGITYLNLDYLDASSSQAPRAQASPKATPTDAKATQSASAGGLRPVIPGDTALIIPSMPNTILEIGESMTQIVRTFRDIDFKALVDRSTQLVSNLEQISSQLNRESGGFTEELLGAIKDTKTAATSVAELADSLKTELSAFLSGAQLKELELMLSDTRRTLNRLDSLMKTPQATLPTTLDNLRVMSENLREFSELARRYPSQIFLGGPPPVGR
ncbi:MAG: MlaD family protein [Deltaproteobacteria bacterium]|jgi:hypothetical protein|nr:MlaD family protein [Deltaproteobacteria bacterium]